MKLRPGTAEDIEALNRIAFTAKAHWGYSAEQMQAWREDLRIDPRLLPVQPMCVAERDGEAVAFAQLATDAAGTTDSTDAINARPWALVALWVQPAHMGKGLGKSLLAWAARYAAERGQAELAIDSEPNAEAFYLSCSAQRVGSVAAPIEGQPQRFRPQLRLPTGPHPQRT